MLTCEVPAKQLTEMAATATRRIPARPAVPVLAGTLVEVRDGVLLCSAFDWDVAVTAHYPIQPQAGDELAKAGRVLVSGRLLEQLVKTLPPSKPVRLEHGDGLEMICGTVRMSLPTMTIEDYPTLPDSGQPLGVLDAKAFATFIKRAAVAADIACTQAIPALSGLYLTFGNEQVQVLASDRYRGVIASMPFAPHRRLEADWSVLVPGGMLLDAIHSLDGGEIRVTAVVDADLQVNTLGLHGDRFSTVGRTLVAKDFPVKLPQLAPPRVDKPIVFDVSEMAAAVKRTMLVIDGGKTQVFPVRLAFSDGICEVSSAQSGSVERGRTSTTIDAAVPAAVTLVVNGRFIVDGLGVLGTDNAEIHPNSNSRAPFLLTAPGDADYRQFVMPVRVA